MVHSSQVQFTCDGRTLVVAEPDSITLVEVRGDGRRRIAIPGVQAVAAFADQVWVATRTGTLIRLARDGRQLDEHALPIDPDGVLIPTTIGGPSALWAARDSVMLVDDLGSLAIVPSHRDAGIQVAGRRFAHYAGLRLTLPTGLSTTLPSGLRITGGSVLSAGTSIALIVEHGRGRDLVVLALPGGRPLQTIGLPPGTIRIASGRGLAVVHDTARRLAVIDLRRARHLGAVVTDGDVTDVAVDPGGSLLAIRLAGGDLRIAAIGERMGAAIRLSPSFRGACDRGVDAATLEPAGAEVSGPPSERLSSQRPSPAPDRPRIGRRRQPVAGLDHAELRRSP